jgi:peroxiredoxin
MSTVALMLALPTTFVINRQGKLVARHTGYADKESYEAAIKPLLANKR